MLDIALLNYNPSGTEIQLSSQKERLIMGIARWIMGLEFVTLVRTNLAY